MASFRLENNRKEIEAIERETFSYGPLEVHKLDVYYPPVEPDSVTPVLIFFYGGGFTSGSRSSPPSNLVYNNLGAFFASRGVLTVIPEYRLVPLITYPQGAEDVQEAIKWVAERFNRSVDSNGVDLPRRRRLFVMGHSAGGVHLASVMLNATLFAPIAPVIRGWVLVGVPVLIPPQGRPGFSAAAIQYYGSVQAIKRYQPLGLLKSCTVQDPDYVGRLPPLRSLTAASESRYIRKGMQAFAEEYKGKGGMTEQIMLEGHDHLSTVLALSTGSGEEWGVQLVQWMMSPLDEPPPVDK
ncbi:Esterase LipI [Psilocybe cubensis]|uniref:BD-FAE-like domain-containing protein n=2 Tax=Psilocybe cubensis TaxID=181762 RepID=A0A8H7Y1H4_PSICU|nr:Esterase LipI [Psilocybe cubensis]KAH9480371.1 Esterase LipI [Psilocybe cubensis]